MATRAIAANQLVEFTALLSNAVREIRLEFCHDSSIIEIGVIHDDTTERTGALVWGTEAVVDILRSRRRARTLPPPPRVYHYPVRSRRRGYAGFVVLLGLRCRRMHPLSRATTPSRPLDTVDVVFEVGARTVRHHPVRHRIRDPVRSRRSRVRRRRCRHRWSRDERGVRVVPS